MEEAEQRRAHARERARARAFIPVYLYLSLSALFRKYVKCQVSPLQLPTEPTFHINSVVWATGGGSGTRKAGILKV